MDRRKPQSGLDISIHAPGEASFARPNSQMQCVDTCSVLSVCLKGSTIRQFMHTLDFFAPLLGSLLLTTHLLASHGVRH